ncbi:hypothetical protein LZC95_06895 [Pendulispora brunnea]|uniref:Uncharacterized protein n=1 Tax=Pendulispora brunnea TaxID=2905690 RepID=A0ABZ2KI17_9BACT
MVLAGIVAVTATACGFIYDPDQLGSSACTDCDASRNDVRNSAHDTDAGGSAQEASDGPLRRGCPYLEPVAFCRDFDDGKPFDTSFTKSTSPGGSLSVSPDSYSPPRSFVASVPAAGVGAPQRLASMYKQFNDVVAGGGPTDIRFAANIQVEQYDTGQLVPVVNVFFGDAGSADEHYISLQLADDRAYVVEAQTNPRLQYVFPFGQVPPVGRGEWPRIDIHLDTISRRISVTLDTGSGPQNVVDGTLHLESWNRPHPPLLIIGVGNVDYAGSALRVGFDDIVFDMN